MRNSYRFSLVFTSLKKSFAILVITAAVMAATTPSAAAQTCNGIPDIECQALYALYNSTGGDNWTTGTNWLSTEPVSGWFGITVEGGHVTKLKLGYNNLAGTIPAEIGDFSELRELWLYGNNLGGSIPPSLGNLSHIEMLSLSENALSGPIPTEIGNLLNLEHLDLMYNELTGTLPPELGNLQDLETLLLLVNDLTGGIPPQIGNMAALVQLQLDINNLGGQIPSELGNLSNLKILGLTMCGLNGEIPSELLSLTGLTDLFLGYNNLTGTVPEELGNMPGLNQLYLSANNFTGTIPPQLGNLVALQKLYLNENNLTGPIPAEIGNLAALEILALDNNELTGPIPPELGGLTTLQRMQLQRNSLAGGVPAELGNLLNLQFLELYSNQLSGDLPGFLAFPPDTLNLSWNCLHASDPAVLAAVEARHSNRFLSTQTIPPENVTAETVQASGTAENRVRISWDPISYVDKEGGYQVHFRQVGEPSYHYWGMTADKEDTSLTVSNLEPGVNYEFKVNSVTWAFPFNKNDLQSPDSVTDSALSGTLARAFIPNWKQAPGYFTGVVVANFGETAFDVDLTAYDPNGIIEPQGQSHQVVNAGRQMSKLGSEFFHGNPYHEDFSWIKLEAENSNRMGSIFLFGVSDTQMLDGAEAQSRYAKRLYFTRPLDEGFFAGWSPEFQMCVVNPNDEEVSVTCTIRGSNGESANTHTIPARGFITGDSEDLTNPAHGINDGYLEIEVTEGPGVVGFSRIEFPGVRTALGMNAVTATTARTMYSAQLAHGLNIVTNLRMVNTSGTTRTVTLNAIGDDGTPVAEPVQVQIAGKKIYSADIGTLFGLEGDGVITTGSLVVETDGNGIIGDIIFAEGDTLEYAMSLPLQTRLFTEAVFNHISNLQTVFTGFAFCNPGEETATVLIEAIGTDGEIVAEKTLYLDAGERIARTLTDPDIWPEFPEQSGGYIKIQSTQPIAGQQLFWDRSLRYMAAIPPTTRLEPMFE